MRLLLPLLLRVLCFLQTCSWPAKVHCFHKLACKRPFGFQTEAKTWTLVLAKKEKSFLHTEAVPGLSETNNALSICTVSIAIDQPHFLFPRQFIFCASTNPPCSLLDMKVFHSCLLFLLLSSGLHEAKAGKSSGSKRKHSSDEESEDWWQWSLKLGAENKIPASVAKTNIEKAEKSGADGFKFKGKGKMLPELSGEQEIL